MVYASRALSNTEKHYTQIENESLAVTWACGHFNEYLTGTTFHVQTDHKPLVNLLSGAKSLDELPPRIQCFRMRLVKYTFTIAHV